jgi:methyltransferase (TIGR00027 family)
VAAQRLTFERLPAPFGNPAADDLLARDVAGTIDSSPGPLARFLEARTAFFDRVVVEALDKGMPQVVVAAAGYDGRALRYAKPGVRWFEVDHPDTQADKRARLERLGVDTANITFVAADFEKDAVDEGLRTAGVDTNRPSLILAEGISVYLELPVLTSLLASLRAIAARRSRLALSVSLAKDDSPRRAAFQERVAGFGEPARTFLTVDEAAELFVQTGWRTTRQGFRRKPRRFLVLEPVPVPGQR